MSQYAATVTTGRTGRVFTRHFPSAEVAAQSLGVLLKANGWAGDWRTLASGETVVHRGNTYHVDPVPA